MSSNFVWEKTICANPATKVIAQNKHKNNWPDDIHILSHVLWEELAPPNKEALLSYYLFCSRVEKRSHCAHQIPSSHSRHNFLVSRVPKMVVRKIFDCIAALEILRIDSACVLPLQERKTKWRL